MEPKESQQMIDSTDSFEAVIVMKAMKNFLFWLLLIALLVAQAIFWMDRTGLIDKSDCPACPSAVSTPPAQVSRLSAPLLLAAPINIDEQVDKVLDNVDRQAEIDPAEPAEADVVITAAPQPDESAEVEADRASRDIDWERLRLSCRSANILVRVCNFVMFMTAVLYCLTLLMNLKISLTGKLGGINHITRAFFCSLFLLVFLTPWQTLLPGIVLGAMYLPGELLCGGWAKADASTFWKALLYLRFTGMWLIVLWLLLCAQSRSVKWARATLRRLGMSR